MFLQEGTRKKISKRQDDFIENARGEMEGVKLRLTGPPIRWGGRHNVFTNHYRRREGTGE